MSSSTTLNDAGAEIIVIFSGATLAEIIGNTKIKHVIAVDTGDGVGAESPSPPVDTRLANVIAFSNVITEGDKFTFARGTSRERDLLLLQYTGGYHGAVERRAALTHRNLVANTEQFAFSGRTRSVRARKSSSRACCSTTSSR